VVQYSARMVRACALYCTSTALDTMAATLTSAGLTVPRGADIASDLRADITRRLVADGYSADDIDWDRDVVWGIARAAFSAQLGQGYDLLQAIIDAMDPNNATGVWLDLLAGLQGVRRLAAAYSQVTVTFTGAAGTIIVAGTEVSGGGADDDARWRTSDDVTVSSGGTVDAVAVCTVTGDISATAGQVDSLVTVVPGVTAVTNAAASSRGRDVETDDQLRRRWFRALAASAAASVNSVRAALLALDFLTSVVVLENDTPSSVTIGGVTVLPNSIRAIVYPSALTTDQQATIVQTLYNRVSGGIRTDGTISATVTKSDGFAKTIKYDTATAVSVAIALSVTLETGYSLADVTTPINTALSTLFSSLLIGDALYPMAVYNAVADVPGVADITAYTADPGTGAVSTAITPTANPLYTLGSVVVS